MPAGAGRTRLSSRAGRTLAALVAVICIGSEVHYFAAQQAVEGERLIPMFAFIIFVAWLVLWTPTVEIGESGITVVNPLRTYRLAWPTLLSTEGRYFLTLVTADRKI